MLYVVYNVGSVVLAVVKNKFGCCFKGFERTECDGSEIHEGFRHAMAGFKIAIISGRLRWPNHDLTRSLLPDQNSCG